MDPGALGDDDVHEVKVLSKRLANKEDAGWVQAHCLLQASLQVGQLGQVAWPKGVSAIRVQLLQA